MKKADAIRAYAASHPSATYAQIIGALAEQGVTVGNSHIAHALGRGRSKKKTTGDWFTRWYKADTKRVGGTLCWVVTRADKESKGTVIGPVRFKGPSCAAKAHEEAERRNRHILQKRQELREMGLGPKD